MARSSFIGIFIFFITFVFSAYLYPQDEAPDDYYGSGTIPETLLTPMRGETSRYPRDRIIGELGQGTAPDGAWNFARDLADALIFENRSSPALSGKNEDYANKIFDALGAIGSSKYHLGGGRTEADGTVSFLLRFLGRNQWIIGELYLRSDEDKWYLDDLVLEEERELEEGKSVYSYDFSPYERFY